MKLQLAFHKRAEVLSRIQNKDPVSALFADPYDDEDMETGPEDNDDEVSLGTSSTGRADGPEGEPGPKRFALGELPPLSPARPTMMLSKPIIRPQ